LGESAERCGWLEGRGWLKAPQAVVDDYLCRVGKKPPPDALTYERRVKDLVGEIPAGAFEPSSREARELDRKRATKVLIEAWLRVPHGVEDLMRVVNRAYFLEGEVFERLKGLCFRAEPLELEVKFRREASKFTKINGWWDGDPTCNGDACLDALEEVLENARRRKDAGEPDSRGRPVRGAQGKARDRGRVAPAGVASRSTAPNPPGVLARGRGGVSGRKPDGRDASERR